MRDPVSPIHPAHPPARSQTEPDPDPELVIFII